MNKLFVETNSLAQILLKSSCLCLTANQNKQTKTKINFSPLFTPAREDVFVIDTPALGPLEKIRVGHDNSGPGPAWFLEKVSDSK